MKAFRILFIHTALISATACAQVIPTNPEQAPASADAAVRVAQAISAPAPPAARPAAPARENVRPVDPKDVLRRVVGLDLNTWTTKKEGAAVRHIGPSPEDLATAFALPVDGGTPLPADANGVSLAAIQGLNQLIAENTARIVVLEDLVAAQRDQIADLTARLVKVERYLQGRVINPGP